MEAKGLRELHLFAGAGGGILGGILLGHTCVCAVEIEPYCRKILLQRQRDGILPKFPIWDDVRTFDGKPWRGRVDVVCGGFPCQDISQAGSGAGLNGERSGLWKEMARTIYEVRPRFVVVENSPMLIIRGLGRVLGDLAGMGFDAGWGVLRGTNAGVPQRRSRMWIVARRRTRSIPYPNPIDAFGNRSRVDAISGYPSDSNYQDTRTRALPVLEYPYWPSLSNGRGIGGIDGLADRVEREKALGNGQIPIVVALAWETLMEAPSVPEGPKSDNAMGASSQ